MKFSHEKNLVPDEVANEKQEELSAYLDYLKDTSRSKNYEVPESSLVLPGDTELLEEITRCVDEKVTGALNYVVVVGIGGSNLGTKALYEAMYRYRDEFSARVPRIVFLDTINSHKLTQVRSFLKQHIKSPSEVLVIMVTKSGTTTETALNSELVTETLEDMFNKEDARARMVAITDSTSPLARKADEKGIARLSIPEEVGGRYSVLSAVGLFPLRAAGVDIEALRRGAHAMREVCTSQKDENNPALMSAITIWHHLREGKNIHDTFFFASEFESIGKWYRQLIGESLGKEGTGITPTVSIGSTDLHSVAQLYLGGPHDKVTTFVRRPREENHTVPEPQTYELVRGLGGRKTEDVMDAILDGTKRAYEKQNMPFMEVEIENTAEDLGAFLQFKMIEVMLTGRLMGVNPFNQPEVELYKEETRKILGG